MYISYKYTNEDDQYGSYDPSSNYVLCTIVAHNDYSTSQKRVEGMF